MVENYKQHTYKMNNSFNWDSDVLPPPPMLVSSNKTLHLATENTLKSIKSVLPASLGSLTSDESISVTFASDSPTIEVNATLINYALESGGNLEAINNKLPATLGQTTKAASFPVVLASDQDILQVQSNFQDIATEITLSSIDSKTPPLGQALMDDSIPVVIASDQSVVQVHDATVSTQLTFIDTNIQSCTIYLGEINGKTPALGQALMAASVPVTIASDQSDINTVISDVDITSQTSTLGVTVSNTGFDSNLTEIASNPISVDAGISDTGTQRVVIATDQSTLDISGTVVANAGTNLNTSLLALESGGNLDLIQSATAVTASATSGTNSNTSSINAKLPVSLGAKSSAGSLSVTLSTDNNVAVESGGNLDTINTSTANLYTSFVSTIGTWSSTAASASAIATFTSSIDSKTPPLGQALMDDSIPVVIASDQSTINTNTAQLNGFTISTGSNVIDNGTQRVVLATDQPNVNVDVQNFPYGTTPTNPSLTDSIAVTFANEHLTSNNLNMDLQGIVGLTPQIGAGDSTTGAVLRTVLSNDYQSTTLADITRLNGTTISTSTGTTDAGTIRVTLSNNMFPGGGTSVNMNLNLINGTTVTKGAGAVGTGSMRVVLSDDYSSSTLADITRLAGTTISVDSGVTDTGTQRVILASDQDEVQVLTRKYTEENQYYYFVDLQKNASLNLAQDVSVSGSGYASLSGELLSPPYTMYVDKIKVLMTIDGTPDMTGYGTSSSKLSSLGLQFYYNIGGDDLPLAYIMGNDDFFRYFDEASIISTGTGYTLIRGILNLRENHLKIERDSQSIGCFLSPDDYTTGNVVRIDSTIHFYA